MGEDTGQGPAGESAGELELWDGSLARRVQDWEQLVRAADFWDGTGKKTDSGEI